MKLDQLHYVVSVFFKALELMKKLFFDGNKRKDMMGTIKSTRFFP